MAGKDQRTHARLQASIEIEVRYATGSCSATLSDLSQGGAGFLMGNKLEIGSPVELVLPGPDERKVSVKAELLRARAIDGGFQCGARFSEMSASKLEAVDYLLGVLFHGAGGGQRAHPRIAHRIDIRCSNPEDLIAMIENISIGGLCMRVSERVELGAELLIVLPGEDGEDLLTLTGKVVNVRPLEEPPPAAFLLGLSFEGMSRQRAAMLDAMLNSLLRF